MLSLTLLLLGCSEVSPPPPPVEPAPPPPPAPTWSWSLPKGLGTAPTVPDDNPMTPEKVELGHQVFMDPRLSVDGSRSCYSCHVNERGGADGRALALGAGDKELTRNTPTIWNVAYHAELYWDGRAASLEAQATGAWKGGNMGVGDALDAKAAEIGALPEYKEAFTKAFGLAPDAAVTPKQVVQALSAYERTLLCGDGDAPLSEAATRGKALFESEGRCVACHAAPYYTDDKYHDLGLGAKGKGGKAPDEDVGRGKVSKAPEDNGKFRTPTLRNVAATAPYFHDGRAATLADAVKFMAGGDPSKDPLFTPTNLTDAQQADVVAFLEGLACSGQLAVLGDPKVVRTE
ncbi:MAG: cytochrome c peroxidase [Myxococcota bacterium]